MKTTLFALCFFAATAALGQTASVLYATPQPLHMTEHDEHASQHAMAQETNLFGDSPYSYAHGEVPLAELGSPIFSTPLGDIARDARREHSAAPKAVRILEKQ